MSGISSGIGLISGIDSAGLIDQLIAIERRPIDTLEARSSNIAVQRTAFVELAAQLLSLQNSVTLFGRTSFFRTFSATSTNDDVLQATASDKAAPGVHTFRVRSLVANHALISRGFSDADTTPIGVGSLTLELGGGKVNRGTELDALNGGEGVGRGTLFIQDRAGGSAEIDLSTAITIDDVLSAINNNLDIHVRAKVTSLESGGATGDRLVIEDLNDAASIDPAARLIISDLGRGTMAADLGIIANVAASRVDGADLVRLTDKTSLSVLNDGNGVGLLFAGTDLQFSSSFGDFSVSLSSVLARRPDTDLRQLNSGNGVRLGTIRITDRSGATADIDLSDARTIGDVERAIDNAGVAVSAAIFNSHLQLTDQTGLPEGSETAVKLTVEDITGHAAADLGIEGDTDGEAIIGRDIFRIETIGDVINAINFAQGNNSFVRASISADGNGIALEALGAFDEVTVTSGENSTAAQDLGLSDVTFRSGESPFQTRRLIAGLNTVLLSTLNGGRGIETGEIRLTDQAGGTTTVDLTSANTLQDVVDLINEATVDELGARFSAGINSAGSGLALEDLSGGTGLLSIEDTTGSVAADLGIARSGDPNNASTSSVVDGGSAQLQYITERTLLEDLNAETGIALGTFVMTDAAGVVFSIVVDEDLTTVGSLIDRINDTTPDSIEARINDTGDGIVIIDTSVGSQTLKIEDQDGGQAASSLHLAGEARVGTNSIDGSFEIRIDIDADDTLQDLVTKINDAGVNVSAAIVNHGGSTNPFGLSLTSNISGRRGEMVINVEGIDLGLETLSRAQDAVVAIGDDASGNILVTSSTNTIEGIVEGVTLELLAASDKPVTVNVAQDVDAIVEAIQAFVDNYNDVLDTIDRNTSFDPDTLDRGPLLGDSTMNLVRSRLRRVILQPFGDAEPSLSRLSSVGLRLGSGSRLQFDETKFREVYEESPGALERLFVIDEKGVSAVLTAAFEALTDDFDGVIARKDTLLSDQQDLISRRVDGLNILLEAKRVRLEAQFAGLETALASLQEQQNALAGLALFTTA